MMPRFEQAALAAAEAHLCGLRRVEVCLTETCNLACDYCDIAHNIASPQKGPIDEGLVDRVAAFAAAHAGPDGVEVVITGGEPLSYWPAVIRAVEVFTSVLGPRLRELRLATNATLIRSDRAAWLADHQVRVTVGVDGKQPAHDAHRTNAAGIGSWRRGTQGVAALTEAGIRPDVSMVVTEETFAEAAAGIEWICQDLRPGSLDVILAAPSTLGAAGGRPDPKAWAGMLVVAHSRWAGQGVRIEPVADVADVLAGGLPILHSDDGAWGGAICVDVHGQAGPSQALLCAGIGGVAFDAADLGAGPFQRWRDRAPARNRGCAGCPALGLCGNTTMYVSAARAASPSARDEWHCAMQRELVALLAVQQ